MGNYGIKVSMKGKDIKSTDPADYALWSKYPNLKYLDVNPSWPTSVTVPANTFNTSYQVIHNLGYMPHRSLYFQDRNGKWFRIPAVSNDGAAGANTGSSASRAVITAEDVNSMTVYIGSSDSNQSAITYNLGHHIMIDQEQ